MIASTSAAPASATAMLPSLTASTMVKIEVLITRSIVTRLVTRPMPTLLTSDSPHDFLMISAERLSASSGPSFSTTSTGTMK